MYTLYLTFDDGPQEPGTTNCLDILAHFSIPATFFMIGDHLRRKKSLLQASAVIESGHLVANHSFTHAKGIGYSQYYSQIDKAANDIIFCQSYFRFPTNLVRLPGNSAWVNRHEISSRLQVRRTCERLQEHGFTVVGWDLEWECIENKGNVPSIDFNVLFNQIYQTITRQNTKHTDHLILLMHDRMFSSRETSQQLYELLNKVTRMLPVKFETLASHPFYLQA